MIRPRCEGCGLVPGVGFPAADGRSVAEPDPMFWDLMPGQAPDPADVPRPPDWFGYWVPSPIPGGLRSRNESASLARERLWYCTTDCEDYDRTRRGDRALRRRELAL